MDWAAAPVVQVQSGSQHIAASIVLKSLPTVEADSYSVNVKDHYKNNCNWIEPDGECTQNPILHAEGLQLVVSCLNLRSIDSMRTVRHLKAVACNVCNLCWSKLYTNVKPSSVNAV